MWNFTFIRTIINKFKYLTDLFISNFNYTRNKYIFLETKILIWKEFSLIGWIKYINIWYQCLILINIKKELKHQCYKIKNRLNYLFDSYIFMILTFLVPIVWKWSF